MYMHIAHTHFYSLFELSSRMFLFFMGENRRSMGLTPKEGNFAFHRGKSRECHA